MAGWVGRDSVGTVTVVAVVAERSAGWGEAGTGDEAAARVAGAMRAVGAGRAAGTGAGRGLGWLGEGGGGGG